jgi:hypothetical protein
MRAAWLVAALWLAGCGPDADGDGFRASRDCDDAAAGVHPGAGESCDGVDNDCDGAPGPDEQDGDGDGWVTCAVVPGGWLGSAAVVGGEDCDDADAERFPGAPERCNGVSDACLAALPAEEQDGDGDGFAACLRGRWLGADGVRPGDCADADPGRHPGAVEVCDGADDDCDGSLSPGELDADGDGYVGCTPEVPWLGAPTGYGDCDDAVAWVSPGALEVCDGRDDDCDGVLGAGERDADRDGVVVCEVTADAEVRGGDCDDTRPETLPGAPEACDGLDNDCDGATWALERDQDRDGYVPCGIVTSWSGDGDVRGGGDCDDALAARWPGAPERLDGVDTDCDGLLLPSERDDDGDGYVEATTDEGWVGPPGSGGDCDDADPTISPGATEGCDGVDQTCDGRLGLDESDRDGDGWIGCTYDPAVWRGPFTPVGGGDCDDGIARVFPGAQEVCDLLDGDCDGLADDEDPDLDPTTLRTFYRDDDHDDFGVDHDTVAACRLPEGYAAMGLDCDDAARHVHPLSREECNGIDDDCDDLVDDDDDNLVVQLVLDWYQDADGDGAGDPSVALAQCAPPAGAWVADGTDCDDADPGVFPGAPELCNGIDDDCDRHPDQPATGGAASELGCDLCTGPADFDVANLLQERWNPCVLDPAAESLCYDGVTRVDTHTDGERLHRVALRTDATAWRPELFLFIPPSKGAFNTEFLQIVAHAGYHAVLVSSATDSALADACEGVEQGCATPFLEEVHLGIDSSPLIEIGPADGIENRLKVLLEHLVAVHPDQGWDAYVQGGAVAWDRVIVGGWSKSALHAVYVSAQAPVAGLVLLSSPNEPIGYPVQTPECRRFALYHDREPEVPVDEFESGFRSIGMDGATQVLDDLAYPWVDDPQIFTTRTYEYDRSDCTPHKSIVYDDCLHTEAVLQSYLDLFCHVGEVDPATCP